MKNSNAGSGSILEFTGDEPKDRQFDIDDNGDERRILGSLTGLTGKLTSQLSINTKSPMLGTHYCYIDDTGAERCFEGVT